MGVLSWASRLIDPRPFADPPTLFRFHDTDTPLTHPYRYTCPNNFVLNVRIITITYTTDGTISFRYPYLTLYHLHQPTHFFPSIYYQAALVQYHWQWYHGPFAMGAAPFRPGTPSPIPPDLKLQPGDSLLVTMFNNEVGDTLDAFHLTADAHQIY